jgi:hypothetical protein
LGRWHWRAILPGGPCRSRPSQGCNVLPSGVTMAVSDRDFNGQLASHPRDPSGLRA